MSLQETEDQTLDEFNVVLDTVKVLRSGQMNSEYVGPNKINEFTSKLVQLCNKKPKSQNLPCPHTLVVGKGLLQHLEDLNKEQISEIFPILNAEKKRFQKELEDIIITLNKQKYISKKLNTTLRENKAHSVPTAEQYADQYTTATESVLCEYKILKHKLSQHTKKNFPAPDQSEDVNQRDIRRSLGVKSQTELYDIWSFIMKLISATVESPENAFIDINDYPIYPPYLELLLRYNIVCRHPDFIMWIRLRYSGMDH